MIDSELARIDASPAAAAAALLQVAREFNGRLELTECLTRVCAITQATFRADRSSIMLWSERKRGFIATADVGTPPDVFARSNRRTFSMQGSPYLDQLASGEVVVIDRSNPEPMAQRLLSHLQVATQVVAPLTGQHGFVGALLVSYERSVHLGREQLDLVRGIAQQAAVAIESARLFTNTQKAAAFRTALSDLALDLNREPDLARMRARVCEGAQAMFAVDGAVLAVGDGDHLSVCAVAGVCGSAMIGQRAPQDACGTLAEVLRQRRAGCRRRRSPLSVCRCRRLRQRDDRTACASGCLRDAGGGVAPAPCCIRQSHWRSVRLPAPDPRCNADASAIGDSPDFGTHDSQCLGAHRHA
jgi:uncharacterized protein YigA (DUF484 family)